MITPKEADNLSVSLEQELAVYEDKIDQYLSRNYLPGKTVSWSVPLGMDSRVIGALIEKYRQGGWSVKQSKESSQFDSYNNLLFYSTDSVNIDPVKASAKGYYKK